MSLLKNTKVYNYSRIRLSVIDLFLNLYNSKLKKYMWQVWRRNYQKRKSMKQLISKWTLQKYFILVKRRHSFKHWNWRPWKFWMWLKWKKKINRSVTTYSNKQIKTLLFKKQKTIYSVKNRKVYIKHKKNIFLLQDYANSSLIFYKMLLNFSRFQFYNNKNCKIKNLKFNIILWNKIKTLNLANRNLLFFKKTSIFKHKTAITIKNQIIHFRNINEWQKLFIKQLRTFIYKMNKRPKQCYTYIAHPNFTSFNIYATISYFKQLHNLKKKLLLYKKKEKRQLLRLNSFFRNFGFRKNKYKRDRKLQRRKTFKHFLTYKRVLTLVSNKKRQEHKIYAVQSMRTQLPYFKIRWQLLKYFLKNYLSKKLNRHKIFEINNSLKNIKKNQLLKFTAKIELQLGTLLLRMQFFTSSKLAHQFIKHGFIFVNYKRIKYTTFVVKPYDTISCFVTPITNHRIFDPVHITHLWPGLYKEHSGRQSPIFNDIPSAHIKNYLSLARNKQMTRNNIKQINVLNMTVKKNSWKYGFVQTTIELHSLSSYLHIFNKVRDLLY